MHPVYICDYVRTPIGRYGGALSSLRADDLAALPIKALLARNPGADWAALDDVILGCANQAGEDNRNVARMALLLAGLPVEIPGSTVNRLCGSGMNAILSAANAIAAGEAELIIAGGVESMSRAPFVMPKADSAFARDSAIYDTTIGWRFINPRLREMYGVDSMPETAENVAAEYAISRADQDVFALASQQKAMRAQENGRLAREIIAVDVKQARGAAISIAKDEHPRADTTPDKLAQLKAPFRQNGSVTAGNSSGVNDGAAALILASEAAIKRHGLHPIARVLGGASAGVAPRVMGVGPAPATKKLLARLNLALDNFGVLEFNEAFAAQVLASLQILGLANDDARINRNGGSIALGHPLGMSGARITGSAALELEVAGAKRALAAMCIGVGQGIALALESV